VLHPEEPRQPGHPLHPGQRDALTTLEARVISHAAPHSRPPSLDDPQWEGRTGVVDVVASGSLDAAPTPAYLDEPEYKAALVEYRKHLPPNERRRPNKTRKFNRAAARLERAKRGKK
jgi:hypothetical protein